MGYEKDYLGWDVHSGNSSWLRLPAFLSIVDDTV